VILQLSFYPSFCAQPKAEHKTNFPKFPINFGATGHFERSSHAAGCAQLVKSARCSRLQLLLIRHHHQSLSDANGAAAGGGGNGGGSITHKSKRERQAGVCGLAGGRGWGVAFRKRDRSKIPNAATAAAATAPAGAACHGARGPRGYRPGACGGVQKN